MPPIVNAQGLTKAFGATPLFREISFTVSDGDRIGLIGPNGSGKSTLLAILSGDVKPDKGEVSTRKRTRLACVAQVSEFQAGETIGSVIEQALERGRVPHEEHAARISANLGRTGLPDLATEANTLS